MAGELPAQEPDEKPGLGADVGLMGWRDLDVLGVVAGVPVRAAGTMGGIVVGWGRLSGGVALLTTGYKPALLAGCDFVGCGFRWCRSWPRSTTG